MVEVMIIMIDASGLVEDEGMVHGRMDFRGH
jgi:hypothetical protein